MGRNQGCGEEESHGGWQRRGDGDSKPGNQGEEQRHEEGRCEVREVEDEDVEEGEEEAEGEQYVFYGSGGRRRRWCGPECGP